MNNTQAIEPEQQEADYRAVMDYLNQYADMFNAMAKEALIGKATMNEEETQSMFDPEKFQSLLSSGVKIDPSKLMNQQMEFMQQHLELWQRTASALFNNKLNTDNPDAEQVENAQPVIEETRGDLRFTDQDWSNNPFYSYLKQAYLLNSRMLQGVVNNLQFEDPKAAEQIKFYVRQYINSVSPTNYILTNPEVCREILETKGENLVKGMKNFIRDMEQSPIEAFKITQSDPDAFTLGKDLAVTPGKVVLQNDLMQLIQYTPTAKEVYARPLLIVPPFINKYYILDLDKKKSLVRWLVAQGYTVFMLSWVNPDPELADTDLSDYMLQGPIAALDAVVEITGAESVNMVGYCVAGTLLAATQAYLSEQGDQRIHSMTLLTTLLDFSEPGEIGNYLSEQTLPLLEKNAAAKGIFDGRILALSFNLLRENNLFWSYFIHNYLKGKDPVPFDILHWNSDSTNLPACIFKEYIHQTYWENRLTTPGDMVLNGVPIDLGKIKTPTYFLSTIADHIVLWQASYRGAQLLSGPVRFVLSGSGHVAGVVNPAEGGKYPYWVNTDLPETAATWFEKAEKHEASWWLDWDNWLAPLSGDKISSQELSPGKHPKFPALEEAPGRYVQVRL